MLSASTPFGLNTERSGELRWYLGADSGIIVAKQPVEAVAKGIYREFWNNCPSILEWMENARSIPVEIANRRFVHRIYLLFLLHSWKEKGIGE